jgi:hypothetical protein
VTLAPFFPREILKVLGCLKELLTGLADSDRLNDGSDFLRLPAILGSFLKVIGRHDRPLHDVRWLQPGPFNLDRHGHGEDRLSLLILHLDPDVLGGCTLP